MSRRGLKGLKGLRLKHSHSKVRGACLSGMHFFYLLITEKKMVLDKTGGRNEKHTKNR